MDELSQKWEGLSDIAQASITELIAGKHQGNVMSSLMSNFDIARRALDTSLNKSEGSAMTEHEKAMESVEAKLNSLKAAWQEFSMEFMNSDALKAGIDLLKNFLETLSSLIDNFGLLGTIGLGVFGKGLFNAFTGGKEVKKNLTDVVNAIMTLKDTATEGAEAAANITSAATESAEAVTNVASASTEGAEAAANMTSAFTEAGESLANVTSSATEFTEAAANMTSVATESAEAASNVASASSEFYESLGNMTSVSTESAEAMANMASVSTESGEALINVASSSSEMYEALGNVTSASTELGETVVNVTSTTSELSEAIVNVVSASTEGAEAVTNMASTGTELGESFSNLASAGTEFTEVMVNMASAGTEGIEAMANMASVGTESAEAMANMASASTEGIEAMANMASTISNVTKAMLGIGAAVAVISLVVTQYKKMKEAAAEAREEVIKSSDDVLDSFDSFESAYIKYHDKTSLTESEEKELSSAIQGTIDALGEKGAAIESAIAANDNYLASLERIKEEELKESARAAKDKKDAAEGSLKEAAIGWETIDGSEVDFVVAAGSNPQDTIAGKLAKKIGGDFYSENTMKKPMDSGSITSGSFKLSGNATTSEILEYYDMLIDYRNALEDNLTDSELKTSTAYKNTKDIIDKLSESVNVYNEGVYESVKANYLNANSIPTTTEEYLKMRNAILNDDEIQNRFFTTKLGIANELDSYYGQYFDLSSNSVIAKRFAGVIKGFGNGSKDGTNEVGTVENFLNLRTAVNNGECTVREYLNSLDEVSGMMEGFDDEERKSFDLELGISDDKIKKQYNDVVKTFVNELDIDKAALKRMHSHGIPNNAPLLPEELQKYFELRGYLDDLTQTELQAVYNLRTKINWENDDLDSIKKQIQREAEYLEAVSFTVDLKVESANIENLSSAISESVSGAGLSTEVMDSIKSMFSGLSGYDATKLFENTANGIRLNADELRRLNDEYESTNIDGLTNKLDALGDRYMQTREELYSLTYGTEEYKNKSAELSGIEAQIAATETLISQYKGLTSAYQTWQRVESAGTQRDMYEDIISGFETVKDEISRGWLDDGTIEFLRLVKGDVTTIIDDKGKKKEIELASASAKDLIKVYEDLDKVIEGTAEGSNKGYSIRDFFTVDEDGNSTNQGVYNFLNAVGHMEEEYFDFKDIVQRDAEGEIIGFDFNLAGGDEAIAEALGVSEELVQIMVRAADDVGFVISMDGTYKQLDVLKEKAEEAAAKLNELGKTDIKFNFNTNDEDEVLNQFEKSLGIWEEYKNNGALNADGTINTSVEGAEEAFTVVSTLQSMLDNLTQPAYMKIDVSQVEKDMQEPLSQLQQYERLTQQEHQLILKGTDTSELKASKNEILDYFEGLSPEIQADLGIKGLSRSEIEAKIETGEITIPAAVDVQVEMSDDLKDIKLMMMNQLGLISDEQLNLTVKYGVDYSAVTNYKPEDLSAVVKYFAEHDEVEKWSPEAKEAFVKYVVDGGDIDKFDPDDKESWVVYNADTKNIDNIGTFDKSGTVTFSANTANIDNLDKTGVFNKSVITTFKANVDKLDEAGVLNKSGTITYKADTTNIDNLEAFNKSGTVTFSADTTNIDNLGTFDKSGTVTFGANTENPDSYQPTDKDATVIFDKDSTIPDGYNPKDLLATVIFNKDSTAVDSYNPPDIHRKVYYTPVELSSSTSGNQSKNGGNEEGGGGVNGTANVNGTAFVRGSWGTKNSGTALVGELGRETLVRGGRYYTIGDNGAEFIKYQRGDIIFNHRQTEELFKNGKVTSDGGRAKSFVNGTAFAEGTAFSTGSGGGIKPKVKSYSSSSSSSSSTDESTESSSTDKSTESSSTDKSTELSSIDKSTESSLESIVNASESVASSADHLASSGENLSSAFENLLNTTGKLKDSSKEFEEIFDWIEVAISRVEEAVDRFEQTANNIYKSWSDRNSALISQIDKVGEEITVQQSAYDAYMAKADAVGLSEEWISKVQNGSFDIDTVTDEELAKKINEYQEYYEKALDCKDAIEELKETESSLYQQRFDNIATQHDDILNGIEHDKNMTNEQISQYEGSKLNDYTVRDAEDYRKVAEYYQSLIAQEQSNISQLQKKRADLATSLQEAVDSGAIEKGSEAWNDMQAQIDDVDLKIQQANTSVIEYGNNISAAYANAFNSISEKYNGILQGYEHTETMLDEYISQAEEKGYIVSKKYYQALIDNEKQNIETLKKEQSDLIAARDKAVEDGTIEKYSQEWYNMSQEIDGVTQEIEAGTTSLIEYKKAMDDIDFETFELGNEYISNLTEEADFLIELLSNKKLHDDNGQLTDEGMATMGLHGQNYNTYMYQADDYGAKVKEIDRRTTLDPNDEDYLDPLSKDTIAKRQEYVELQHEAILNAESEKNAIKDLVEEGINLELEALDEKISKYEEALQSQKDLYDYQKKVKKQTKEISSLEKQMAAYEGDDSEEAKAKIQELKVSLEEEKESLEETEYDKFIDDTSALLDNLYTEYELILNERLDNIDTLISDSIDAINASATTIGAAIFNAANTVGFTLSTEMQNIWGIDKANNVVVSETQKVVDKLVAEGLLDRGKADAIITALGIGDAQGIVNATNIVNGLVKDGLLTHEDGEKIKTAMNTNINGSEGVLSVYGEDFKGKATTTNTTLSGIKTGVDKMVENSDKEAEKTIGQSITLPSSVKNPITGASVVTETPVSGGGSSGGGGGITRVETPVYEDNYEDSYEDSSGGASSGGGGSGGGGSGTETLTDDELMGIAAAIWVYGDKSGWDNNPTRSEKFIEKFGAETAKEIQSLINEHGSNGDLYDFWVENGYNLDEYKYSAFKLGAKKIDETQLAWTQEGKKQEYIVRPSDGAILTPVAKGDSVLNAQASSNIWDMANNPAEFIKDNFNFGYANVPNNSNVQSSYIQNLENVVFSFPNVKNYDEMLAAMQKDPNFDRLITSMSIGKLAGKSSLAKGKAIR